MKIKKESVFWILMILLFLQLTYSTTKLSLTNDEIAHIPAGYHYLKNWDFRLNPEHPPLIKQISAIPLLFMDINSDTKDPYYLNASYTTNSQWEYGKRFMFKYNDNADNIIFWSRIPIILLALLLGYYVFLWAKELFGTNAGLFSLFLYVLSPTVLSQSNIVTTDLGIACFMFISFYYFWKLNKEYSTKNLALSGIFFGLAMCSKFTALYMLPMYALIYILVLLKNAIKERKLDYSTIKSSFKNNIALLKHITIIGLIALLVINIDYGFDQDRFLGEEKAKFAETLGKINPTLTPISSTLLKIIPIPNDYMAGLNAVSKHSLGGHAAYLMSKQSKQGWWYYFFVTFFIKTPIPTIILLMLTIYFFKITKKEYLTELMLIIPTVTYFLFFVINNINIGHRHILPVYPFMFVSIGRIWCVKKHWKKYLIVILSIWYILSAVLIFPHHISYFNELAGGPNKGHKYLIDSNIDYGQDLKNLKEYIDKNNIKNINLAYWGTDSPDYRKIDYKELNCTPISGISAVSVNYKLGLSEESNKLCFAWLDDYEPIAKAGYSIWIYDIKDIEPEDYYSKKCKDICKENCIKNNKKYLSSIFIDNSCECKCTD